jgi:4-hydroxy 2-oxovalerate aldolase
METNNKLEILDCTIRDGGYYNNWDFDDNLVNDYLGILNNLPISYVEIGYKSIIRLGFRGLYSNLNKSRLEEIKLISNHKLALMIDLKDVDCDDELDELLSSVQNYIDLIRLTVNPNDDFSLILRYVTFIQSKFDFKIALNMMYASKWTLNEEIFSMLKEDIGIHYFYIVDSYGGLTPNTCLELVNFVKNNISNYTKIGFHPHNNLELAFANTISILDRIDIIDATVLGMGRGAGNLKLELLLLYLNKNFSFKFPINYLGKLVSIFENLLKEFGWGTNLPYMIAGFNSFPQKEVMDWVQTRVISLDTIINSIYSKNDHNITKVTGDFYIGEKVLLIGGGRSILKFKKYLLNFLLINPDYSLVFSSSKYLNLFHEVPNLKFLSVIGDNEDDLTLCEDSIKFVLSSSHSKVKINLPLDIQNRCFLLPLNNDLITMHPNHLSNCLNLISVSKINEFKFAGFDGYSSGTYFDNGLFDINNSLFLKFKKNYSDELISLTPTKYSALSEYSLFYFI